MGVVIVGLGGGRRRWGGGSWVHRYFSGSHRAGIRIDVRREVDSRPGLLRLIERAAGGRVVLLLAALRSGGRRWHRRRRNGCRNRLVGGVQDLGGGELGLNLGGGLRALLREHLARNSRLDVEHVRGGRDRSDHEAGDAVEHLNESDVAVGIGHQRKVHLIDVAARIRVDGRRAGRAANAHGGNRRVELHVAGVRHVAGDEAEGALHQADDGRVRGAVGIVEHLAQHHAGARAHVEHGTVDQAEHGR